MKSGQVLKLLIENTDSQFRFRRKGDGEPLDWGLALSQSWIWENPDWVHRGDISFWGVLPTQRKDFQPGRWWMENSPLLLSQRGTDVPGSMARPDQILCYVHQAQVCTTQPESLSHSSQIIFQLLEDPSGCGSAQESLCTLRARS